MSFTSSFFGAVFPAYGLYDTFSYADEKAEEFTQAIPDAPDFSSVVTALLVVGVIVLFSKK